MPCEPSRSPYLAPSVSLSLSHYPLALRCSLTCHTSCITGARILPASKCIPHPFSLALLALALATSCSLCSLVLSPHPDLSLSCSLALLAYRTHASSLLCYLDSHSLSHSHSPPIQSPPSYPPSCPDLCRQYGSSPYHLLSSFPLLRFLAFMPARSPPPVALHCALSLSLAR